ncbi:exodeoxyribonuclease III [Alphaproteobacteria bacterium]|nr:exodeoxyribonuclease III [Alphaproteobacteria bacterium]GHS96560.1 exodeoxyribonuclease III [Alphaproteobacteria bacterium]
MKIVTWNVNSVRARAGNMAEWIRMAQPDVLLLQELKCVDAAFPREFFEDLGFSCAVLGQKAYNGVAILSRYRMEDITLNLPTFPEDPAARYIEAVLWGHVRVASLYLPNGGQTVGGEAYRYKLRFFQHFQDYVQKILRNDELFLVGGDYNVAPEDQDVHNDALWRERVCCTTEERQAFAALKQTGLTDLFLHFWEKSEENMGQKLGKRPFTWWPYMRGAFAHNQGLRLDHFLVNTEALSAVACVFVDTTPRQQVRPSDHAPLICELNLPKE